MDKLPITVMHHSRFDPREHRGGVETFARNLELVFRRVEYSTPGSVDPDRVRAERRPVICDNQGVLDWPDDVPLIGFQHGVAEIKAALTRSRTDRQLAKQQQRASSRANTLWVACAAWISRAFGERHGSMARHVVYHPVDTARFDGRLDNGSSRLVLHDARTEHKGKRLIPHLVRAFPNWRFESLDCPTEQVADRLRTAAAFLHLSRYEGNSIMCNEAMAMDLPCLFTRVGLMHDGSEQFDVCVVEPEEAFGSPPALVERVAGFLESLSARRYNPRSWVLAHATPDHALGAWSNVMAEFAAQSGWNLR